MPTTRCTHLPQLRRHEAREIAAGRAEPDSAPPTLAQEKGREYEAAYIAARRDIIVVAPYNAQRVALQTALGPGVEVGTVDKFQGQEAPIAILSLTASSRDELPRGLEFLLDPHRINVAISRARSLALVVCSPQLARTSAATIAEMRLLNDLVRLSSVTSGRSPT